MGGHLAVDRVCDTNIDHLSVALLCNTLTFAGEHQSAYYRRSELGAFVAMHGSVSRLASEARFRPYAQLRYSLTSSASAHLRIWVLKMRNR